MNHTEDKYDNDAIHESLLPYASPAIIDDKSNELDTSFSPDDLREIAILLNRETTFWRYAMLTSFSILFICLLTLASFFALANKEGVEVFYVIIFLPVLLGMCTLIATFVYLTILRNKIQNRMSRKRYRRYNDPLDQAVHLLNTAGYKAKYHKHIDMSQFDAEENAKQEETYR